MRKRPVTLLVLAAIFAALVAPAASWANKACPKCGKTTANDDDIYCTTCGSRYSVKAFGTPDLEEYLDQWEQEGDVTVIDGIMCLSETVPYTHKEFDPTARVKIGDNTWADYKVKGKFYIDPVTPTDSKMFRVIFRENPKEKFRAGGGTETISFRPNFEPIFNDYADDDNASPAVLYKEEVVTKTTIRKSGKMLYEAVLCTALAVGGITGAVVQNNNGGDTTAPLAIGVGFSSLAVLCFSGYAKGWWGSKSYERKTVDRGYDFKPGTASVRSEEWVSFDLVIRGGTCNLDIDNKTCVSRAKLSSRNGPLSFESIDGCKVYLDGILIEDLSGAF